jgi:glyoxylase-like metal-dependent hydrolase (beta-lactamase superfamily II)
MRKWEIHETFRGCGKIAVRLFNSSREVSMNRFYRLSTSFKRAFASMLGAATLTFVPAHAAPPAQLKTQVPGYYRMQLGAIEITALYDGYLDLDTKLLKFAKPGEVQKLVARMFQTMPAVQTAVNAYLIHTGTNLVLVDAGAGKLFGPSLGFVMENLKAAGYTPEQVDTILITHMHGDHVNGLVGGGKALFPNAVMRVAKADAAFWLNPDVAAKAPKDAQAFFKMAMDSATPYKASGKWSEFDASSEVVPGIKAVATPGHTPGHTSFLVTSGSERLMIWGDLVHNYATQFVNPNIAIEFDTDPKAAIVARKRMFAEAVKEKYWVAGMHLPFPGIGHVRKDGNLMNWVPVEFGPIRSDKK